MEYWSIVAALRPSAAQRCLGRLEYARAVNDDDVADRFSGAALELDLDALHVLEAEATICEVASSDGVPALSAIDRFFALPRGLALLEGRPMAWLPAERRERLEDAWRRLLADSGGSASLARCIAPYLDSSGDVSAGVAAVQRAADALGRVLASARERGLDVLLVCGACA